MTRAGSGVRAKPWVRLGSFLRRNLVFDSAKSEKWVRFVNFFFVRFVLFSLAGETRSTRLAVCTRESECARCRRKSRSVPPRTITWHPIAGGHGRSDQGGPGTRNWILESEGYTECGMVNGR